jgi:hypothetical protein
MKSIYIKVVGILFLSVVALCSNAQTYFNNLFWITTEASDVEPLIDGTPTTANSTFNSILSSYSVTYMGQAFPNAKNTIVSNTYEIRCNGCNIDNLINAIKTSLPTKFSRDRKIEILPNTMAYDPADYMWYLTTQNPTEWLWHLKKIQADLAWNITIGSPSIRIGILDTEFDITHPDLQNKFVVNADPFTNIAFDCTPVNSHGTTVASFAAAETIEQGQTGNSGQLASVGFKTMIVGYNAWNQNFLQKAFHASTVMNCDIITSSAGGWSPCPDLTGVDALVVQEILNNGTTIIMPAGNGVNGTHNICTSVDPVNHTPWFPLSPVYDPRIIIVTGVTKTDNHYYFDTGLNQERTHSHFPMVDVAAPGHQLLGATQTDCGSNTWPYTGWGAGGTSFATPIVAGTASLMISVNQCMDPQDIEFILKTTTDPIVDAASYPGMVGTGRINAYNAVQTSQTYGDVAAITGAITWNTEKYVKGTVNIESGGTLTITSKIRLAKQATIIVKRGGKLIIDGGTLTNAQGCNQSFWEGIYVWGDKTKSQYTASGGYNHTDQGYLEIKNNSRIENARNAIRTVKLNTNQTLDDNYTGGIVIASNSSFYNNYRSAEFRSYRNFNPISPTVTLNNVSSFTNCQFVTDDKLKEVGVYPLAFLTMWSVKGVGIKDNKFKCSYVGYTDTQRGKGITSLDAVYDITKTTTPGIGNGFENLDVAVELTNSASAPVATNYISYNSFTNNRHGVYSSGFGIAPNITYNNFTKTTPAVSSPSSFGFYSTGTKAIFLTCNTFSNLTYGNLILSSGNTGDAVCWTAENTFTSNYRSLQTQNNNQTLQVRYNNFSAFASTQMHWYNTTASTLPQQGFCAGTTTPSGNKFLGSAPSTYKDIRNDGPVFSYYHHNSPTADVIPVLYVSTVTLNSCAVAWTATNYCNAGMQGMMAGGGNGGEEFSLAESFEAISDEQDLYGEEATVADLNDHIYTTGLDTNPALAIEYLEGINNEQADWMLAPYYIIENNYEEAAAILNILEADNANEATKLNYFLTINNAGLDGRNLSQLDSVEVAALDIIAVGNSDVRDNARSVLHFFYGRNYPIEEISVMDIPLYFDEPIVEELIIPNIITPNGDGSNDVFVIGSLPEHSALTIYNSSGTQVYHSDNYANNWPPSGITAGRYYYTLNLTDGRIENSYFDVVY